MNLAEGDTQYRDQSLRAVVLERDALAKLSNAAQATARAALKGAK